MKRRPFVYHRPILRRRLRADRRAGDCLPSNHRYLWLVILYEREGVWTLRIGDGDDAEVEWTRPIPEIQAIYRKVCARRRWSIYALRTLTSRPEPQP